MAARRHRSGKRFCNHLHATMEGFTGVPIVALQIVRSLLLVGFFAILVAGCSDGRPRRVPVSGQILIDGKPLTFGDLQFVTDGARPSYGKVDSNGHFTLTCYDGNDGVVPGLHRVGISGSEI